MCSVCVFCVCVLCVCSVCVFCVCVLCVCSVCVFSVCVLCVCSVCVFCVCVFCVCVVCVCARVCACDTGMLLPLGTTLFTMYVLRCVVHCMYHFIFPPPLPSIGLNALLNKGIHVDGAAVICSSLDASRLFHNLSTVLCIYYILHFG